MIPEKPRDLQELGEFVLMFVGVVVVLVLASGAAVRCVGWGCVAPPYFHEVGKGKMNGVVLKLTLVAVVVCPCGQG